MQRARQLKAGVHHIFHGLNQRLQRVAVVLQVEFFRAAGQDRRTSLELEQRVAERAGHVFDGPFQLVNQLRVNGADGHALEFQAVAQHCDSAGVVAFVAFFPMLFQPRGGIVADAARGGKQSARRGLVFEKPRAGVGDRIAQRGAHAARIDRADAHQRVEQRRVPVVHDLGGRHGHVGGLVQAAQVVAAQLVIHVAAVGHEHGDELRLQHDQLFDAASAVANFEAVRVAGDQLGQRPMLDELKPGLVMVRPAHEVNHAASGLRNVDAGILPHHVDGQLGNVASDAADAAVHRRKPHDVFAVVNGDVLLPSAWE